MPPFEPAVGLLRTIPGVERRSAEVLIAETGGDMSAFPSAKHLASWAGVCPGQNESAGKRKSGKTRTGSPWLRATLIESARAASRSKGTYLGERYRRLARRRGDKEAIVAICHEILTATWHMLTTGELTASRGPRCSPSATPRTPAAAPSASSSGSATRSPSTRSSKLHDPTLNGHFLSRTPGAQVLHERSWARGTLVR